MRILWIEDFPKNEEIKSSTLASNLFRDLLNLENFDEDYDSDNNVEIELPQYFKSKGSIHDIKVCLSYDSFKKDYEKKIDDFDVLIIDINLSDKEPKNSIIPKESSDRNKFLEKAGFYIWNLLIRKGIPENHLAFMTGNGNSIEEFKKHCIVSNIPILKNENVFEKSVSGYSQFRKWLGRRANTDYIQLRRGILDACKLFQENEHEILLNQTLKEDGDGKKIDELSKEYGKEFIIHIKNLFLKDFLLEGKEKTQRLYTFLMVLSAEWERGDSKDEKQSEHFKNIENISERSFYESIFWIMSNLRNCFAHFTFPKENLIEQDIAFFFILAMHGFFKMNIEKIEEYEKILFTILNNSNVEINKTELVKINKNSLEQIKSLYKDYRLDEAYQGRNKEKVKEPKDFKGSALRFLSGCKQNENKTLNPIPKEDIQKESKKIFYNSYLIKMETPLQNANSKDKLFYKLGAFAFEAAYKK